MGKCLAGSHARLRPGTGARRRIDELVEASSAAATSFVASWAPTSRFRALQGQRRHAQRRAADLPAHDAARPDGSTPRRTTRCSRSQGWRELGELRAGRPDRRAAAASRAATSRALMLDDHELVLLAALIADGNLTQKHAALLLRARLAGARRGRARRRARWACPQRRAGGHGTATISAGRGGRRNPVTALLPAARPLGARLAPRSSSRTRSSRSPDEQLARFLAVLYACDGHVYASERLCQIGYTTISERLAARCPAPAAALGIVAHDPHPAPGGVRGHRQGRARGAASPAETGLDAFAATIPVRRQEAARSRAWPSSERRDGRRCYVDTLPRRGLGSRPRREGRAPVARDQPAHRAHPRNHNWHVGRRGLSRPLLAELADRDRCAELEQPRHLRPLVGRGRVDRAARRAGDVRPHGSRRPQLRRRRHRRPQQRADGQLLRERGAGGQRRPSRCSRSRCRSPSSRSGSSRRRPRSRATTCARATCRRRAGRRSCRRARGWPTRRCTSTTRRTCRCSTCARRRGGSRSSTPTGSG